MLLLGNSLAELSKSVNWEGMQVVTYPKEKLKMLAMCSQFPGVACH